MNGIEVAVLIVCILALVLAYNAYSLYLVQQSKERDRDLTKRMAERGYVQVPVLQAEEVEAEEGRYSKEWQLAWVHKDQAVDVLMVAGADDTESVSDFINEMLTSPPVRKDTQ